MFRISICLVLIVHPGQIFAAPKGLAAPDPDTEWRAALILLVNVRLRPWAIECICARRQRKQKRRVRRIKRNGQPRAEAVAWQRLKPVLEEIVQAEVVQETTTSTEISAPANDLTDFSLPVQVVVVTPDYSRTVCPTCGGATKCKRSYYSHPQDINLEQPTILQVYREIRECRDQNCEERTAPALDFVSKGGRFTKRAKQKVIDSVIEDGVPLTRVPRRMWRDFHVRVAQSTVHKWVHEEAEADLGEAEYTQWVVERFSGVVGIDEVHVRDENGQKQYLVVAVDPINDRTILFDLLDSRDTDAMAGFLENLEEMGIDPLVVITDMWKSYGTALEDVFPDAAHQLCVFHVVKNMMKYTYKAMLAYRRELPKETEAQETIKKALWKYRYLLLKADPKLTDKQRERVEDILRTHRGTVLEKAYCCKEAFLALFRESQTKKKARERRDEIIQQYGEVPELEKVINLLRGERFEQMIIYLAYENLDKTNNDAERENRVYQKGEKTRYRARTTRTRLNYVRLRARQRNRHSTERNERLKRRPQHPILADRVNVVAEREARSLTM